MHLKTINNLFLLDLLDLADLFIVLSGYYELYLITYMAGVSEPFKAEKGSSP
jgi:hypothetical protein